MERKKIIKGLELCEIGSDNKCYETECPYYGQGCTESLKNDILDLLKEPEVVKGYWFINEPEYLTCSECGFNYYTGYESTKEAQEHYNKPFGLYFCPHCGSEMTRKDGSDICLCVN